MLNIETEEEKVREDLSRKISQKADVTPGKLPKDGSFGSGPGKSHIFHKARS